MTRSDIKMITTKKEIGGIEYVQDSAGWWYGIKGNQVFCVKNSLDSEIKKTIPKNKESEKSKEA